jgi:putative transposase
MVLVARTHREERGESQAPPSRRVVALDPGVRAFQTLYDPQQAAIEQWGEGDQERIIRLCLDALESQIGRLRQRIRDLVDDLHHQLAAHLVDNYALILLPTFVTSEMVPRKGRVIRSKTARSMLTSLPAVSAVQGARRSRLPGGARLRGLHEQVLQPLWAH